MQTEIPALFIVGHARTGTTILLDALNTAPEIFLFGESNFHFSMHKKGFRSWYNEMHRVVFGNPRAKSYYCPELLPKEATGEDYLRRLSEIYLLVGDKVAFRDESVGPYEPETFLAFQERNFYSAKYLFTMRHPASTLASCAALFDPESMVPYVRSYLRTLLLIVEMARIFRRSRVVVQEQVVPETLDTLSEFLSADLSGAFDLYSRPRQLSTDPGWGIAGVSDEHRTLLSDAWNRFLFFYDRERLGFRNPGNELQTWQKELGRAVHSISIKMEKR